MMKHGATGIIPFSYALNQTLNSLTQIRAGHIIDKCLNGHIPDLFQKKINHVQSLYPYLD